MAFANISGTKDTKNSDVQVQNETFCKTKTEIILLMYLKITWARQDTTS